jgi:gag-polyprotein putative aspartyl protease
VVVDCKIRHHNFALAVDTGASHTVIDLTALLLIGFTMQNVVKTVQLETGKGVIDAYVFRIDRFNSLGKTVENMEICSYDFIGNAIFSDFEGVLGLDFFKNSDLNISFKNYTISLT